ncbi:hypothetical protein CSHISOI_01883 [Colletotrichum shisoi]|uniref:Uncharacterized protein n=1 Tax=Colletotrichum shisoi TaxID=2078593 RepID=A0A5Q4C420_9PEZI|nr:hypothetical protein CSHISOI_01883 [Colletotrichum shisoi]
MKLTPIRARGRRSGPSLIVSTTPANQENAPQRAKRLASKRKSLLERQIPLEIMEQIFVLSENLNLPRCSPLLGRLLSGRSTLVRLFIAAFQPTWDCCFGVNRQEVKTVHNKRTDMQADTTTPWCFDFVSESYLGDPEFQSGILACQWLSMDIILEAQRVWARRFACDRWFSHTHVSLEDEDAKHCYHPTHNRSGGFGHFESTGCFEYDWVQYGINGVKPSLNFYVDVHPHTTIPDELVMGPWTTQQQMILFWLRRGSARIQPNSQTWEILLKGIQNAVTDRSPNHQDGRLIQMLLLQEDFFPTQILDKDHYIWPLEVLDKEKTMVKRIIEERQRSGVAYLPELDELNRRMVHYRRRHSTS